MLWRGQNVTGKTCGFGLNSLCYRWLFRIPFLYCLLLLFPVRLSTFLFSLPFVESCYCAHLPLLGCFLNSYNAVEYILVYVVWILFFCALWFLQTLFVSFFFFFLAFFLFLSSFFFFIEVVITFFPIVFVRASFMAIFNSSYVLIFVFVCFVLVCVCCTFVHLPFFFCSLFPYCVFSSLYLHCDCVVVCLLTFSYCSIALPIVFFVFYRVYTFFIYCYMCDICRVVYMSLWSSGQRELEGAKC